MTMYNFYSADLREQNRLHALLIIKNSRLIKDFDMWLKHFFSAV